MLRYLLVVTFCAAGGLIPASHVGQLPGPPAVAAVAAAALGAWFAARGLRRVS
jgi:uncharacterized membrane protein YfcA